MTEDAELLRSYAESQSESDFSELVSRHLNLVYSAALRRTGGDSHRASDITQQVFISFASHAGSLARHPSLVGWLYTCTRNAVLMDVRAEKRRQEREQEAYAMQSLEPSSSAEADWTQLRPVLDEAMDELSGRDREAVLLRFFTGCSYREVGAKLLVAEDAARMRVDRAIDKLRGSLAKRGLTSTAAALGLALANQTIVAAPVGLAQSISGAALGGAGAPAALGLLKIMSTTKASIGIASVICILAVGSAIYEARQAREAESSLALANEANLGRIHDLQARLTAAKQTQTSSGQTAQATKVTGQSTTNRRNSSASNPDEMRKDPAFAALWRKQQLRTIQQKYGYAFAAMRLPPADLAKLKDLLVARVQARLDAVEVGQEAGLNGAELNAAARQAESSITDEINGLVGADGAAQLQASQRASQYEPLIASSFAIDLNAAGIPLTSDQVASLAQSFSDHEAKFGPGAGKQKPDPQTGLTPFYQTLVDQISSNLTSAQLQVMKDYFIELEQQGQFSRKQTSPAAGGH